MSQPLHRIPTQRLQEWAKKYPWWGAVKIALDDKGERVEQGVVYAARARERLAPPVPQTKNFSSEEFNRNETLDIIDDFLLVGEHRIVVDELTSDEALDRNQPIGEDEDEFVSEELAEIYVKQHLFDLAIEIYEKLSLQDSQKSVYFAELIEELKKRSLEEDNKK